MNTRCIAERSMASRATRWDPPTEVEPNHQTVSRKSITDNLGLVEGTVVAARRLIGVPHARSSGGRASLPSDSDDMVASVPFAQIVSPSGVV